MVYAVFITENFQKEMVGFSQSDREKIQKVFLQLKENPFVGDAIRYRFFREKRIKEKRIYYLIYDDLSAVLIVAISGKKTQQKTIDYIIRYLPEYRRYVKNLFR
ncbi:MAG: hypothetical protein ABIF18_00130 [archaeon]